MKNLLVKSLGVGQPLMMLHGWGMNSSVWKPVIKYLEPHYQIHLVDLPGHGFNRYAEAESMQNIVNQLITIIDDLNIDKIHILGWSLGGLVAQAVAEKVPDKIQSLNLVASTLRFVQDDSAESLWPHAMSKEVLNGFVHNLNKDMAGTLKRFIALQFMGIAGSKEIQRELMQSIGDNGDIGDIEKSLTIGKAQQVVVSSGNDIKVPKSRGVTSSSLEIGLQLLLESDFRYSDCKLPQHWLFAENDRLIPKKVINDLKILRSDAQITLLEKAGHAPFMTHPLEFASAITTFIDEYA